MMTAGGIFARAAGAAMASMAIWSLGCEQIIGLDGPYVADPGGEGGSGGAAGVCMDGAKEECYSGDPALKGIGACQPGTRACSNGAWGACAGEGAPTIEHCAGNDDDCNGEATCTGAVRWALSFGSTGNDSSTAIVADAANNVIVAGSFTGTASFGGAALSTVGGSDVVVFKLDPDGKHIWSKAFGSTGTDNARGLWVDASGNIIVIGLFSASINFGGGPLAPSGSSLFIAKLNPDGEHVWSKAFVGAMSFTGTDLTVGPSGNILFSTILTGTTDFGGGLQSSQGEESLAVVKLDASGNHVWSKVFGAAKAGSIDSAIAVDAAGNVGIAGTFNGQMTVGGSMFTSSKRDIVVAKLSPAGVPLWSAQGTAAGDCQVNGAAFDKTGGFVISGAFPSPSLAFGTNMITGFSNNDAYVARFDSAGAFLWGKAFGMGGLNEVAAEVEVDAANNISLAGTTTSNSLDFGTGTFSPAGVFVVKLDPAGKIIWVNRTEAAMPPYPDPCISVDSQGHTLLTRAFLAPFAIGGTNLPSMGGTDIFVIKLGP